jgi:hypothetical protein
MTRNLHALAINSLLNGPPINVLIGYQDDTRKKSLIKNIIDLSVTLDRQLVYIDTFSNFLQLKDKPLNLVVVSPFEMTLDQFFSRIICSPKEAIIIVDSYPSIVNVFFGDEERADRLFLYFLSRIKHLSHLIIFVRMAPNKGPPTFPIFNKRFYDKFLYHKDLNHVL